MSERELVRAQFDPQVEQSVSVVVAETLALVAADYDTLPPLAEQVDTDSLDALFSAHFGPTPDAELVLSFPYEVWTVTVSGDGYVAIQSRSDHEIASP